MQLIWTLLVRRPKSWVTLRFDGNAAVPAPAKTRVGKHTADLFNFRLIFGSMVVMHEGLRNADNLKQFGIQEIDKAVIREDNQN